jgi:hypothetical protein
VLTATRLDRSSRARRASDGHEFEFRAAVPALVSPDVYPLTTAVTRA